MFVSPATLVAHERLKVRPTAVCDAGQPMSTTFAGRSGHGGCHPGVCCAYSKEMDKMVIYIYILIYAVYVESWDTMWHIIWISHDSKYGYTME